MIKALLTDGTLILGLSRENLTRLLKAQPIPLQLSDVGLPAQKILIVGGETEQAIYEELKKHVELAPNALVHGMPDEYETPPKAS